MSGSHLRNCETSDHVKTGLSGFRMGGSIKLQMIRACPTRRLVLLVRTAPAEAPMTHDSSSWLCYIQYNRIQQVQPAAFCACKHSKPAAFSSRWVVNSHS